VTTNSSPLAEEDDGPVYSGFRLQERGLVPVGHPSREEWLRCLDYLIHAERHLGFWIGDLLAYGEKQWGATYAELGQRAGYDAGTLRNLKWVASRVAPEQRHPGLSFAHHQEVARLPPEQQETVLARAEEEGWTSRGVRREAYRLAAASAAPPEAGSPDPGLHLGDCRDILAQLPDESIDLLLTDPPYGISYVSPARTLPFDPIANDDGDEAFDILDGALAAVAPKLRPDAHVYVFSCWKTYRPMVEVVRRHFALRNVLVWAKNSWGVGDLEAAYGDQQELVIFAEKGHRTLNGAPQSNVLPFDRVGTCQLQHPTQKPVDLLAYLIARSTHERGLVVDPFMGSGSTCIAARNTRRRYLGVELDEQWYEVAQRRLADPSEEG
jgi:site-specific DNA-methyltransferase (adenine-specific)